MILYRSNKLLVGFMFGTLVLLLTTSNCNFLFDFVDATPEDDFDECDQDPNPVGCPPESRNDEETEDDNQDGSDNGEEQDVDDGDEGSSGGGLRVIASLSHNEGSAEMCVRSDAEDLGCETLDLTDYENPFEWEWQFSEGSLEDGDRFTVCVSDTSSPTSRRCSSGVNGPESEPERISMSLTEQNTDSGRSFGQPTPQLTQEEQSISGTNTPGPSSAQQQQQSSQEEPQIQPLPQQQQGTTLDQPPATPTPQHEIPRPETIQPQTPPISSPPLHQPSTPPPQPQQDPQPFGLQTYTNNTLAITIQYPGAAKITERGNSVAFTLPTAASGGAATPAYVIVSTSDLQTPDMPLDQYSNVTLSALGQSRAGFSLVEQDATNSTLSGNPANKIIFTEGSQQPPRKTMQIWTVNNGKSYTISYVTDTSNFDSNLQTAQQMIDSFQILGAGGGGQQAQPSSPFTTPPISETGQETTSTATQFMPAQQEDQSGQASLGSEGLQTPPSSSTSEGTAPTSSGGETQTVALSGGSLQPSEIEIKVGDTVTWTIDDGPVHSITSAAGSTEQFDSSILNAGDSFSHTFNSPGTFEYSCTIHGSESGTVKVS